jgi:nucleoside-diphosphate-sugar epimerase
LAAVKLLVTGASGFIGRHVLAELALQNNFATVANARATSAHFAQHIAFDPADLLEPGAPAALIARVRPTHLLHLAWEARPGRFWTTPDNLRWAAATLELFSSFAAHGGERAIFAGSVAEYDWTGAGVLYEAMQPSPATLYGIAKDSVRRLVCGPVAASVTVAWGRVFWLYGDHEPSGRLVSDVISALVSGATVETSEGYQERDFIHVEDVAKAFVTALTSSHLGPFNIASGVATPVRRIVGLLADEAGRPDLVHFGARASPAEDPPRLVGDVTILRDRIGFSPTIGLQEGLSRTFRAALHARAAT